MFGLRCRRPRPDCSPCARCGALLPAAAAGAGRTRPGAGSKRLARYMRGRGRLLGRLRGQRGPTGGPSSAGAPDAAHPGLEHQALHHGGRAGPLRRRGHAGHRGARRGRARPRTASGAATSICAAAATPPSAAAGSPAARTAAGPGRGAGRPARGGRHRARDRAGVRGRVALRLAAAAAPSRATGSRPGSGPLSALAYNRGLGTESGRWLPGSTRPRSRPPGSTPALEAPRHPGAAARRARAGARRARACWRASSRRRWRGWCGITNKPSDNFFAEMLVKGLAPQAGGRGTTAAGARLAARFAAGSAPRAAARATARACRAANRASPYRVVRLLRAMRGATSSTRSSPRCRSPGATARWPRMRRGPARGRCRGKTGTISGVCALSGLLPRPLGRDLRLLDPDERPSARLGQ